MSTNETGILISMKTIFLTLILIVSFTTFAAADPKNPQQISPKPNKRALLEKFDVNGDGKLSQEEREAAKSVIQQRRAAINSKYDKDGDGKLNAQEREAAREEIKALQREYPFLSKRSTQTRIIQRFDQDGDGQLNREERQAANTAWQNYRQNQGNPLR